MAKKETPMKAHAESITVANDDPMAEYSISHEEISRLAYSYWQARGCPIGSPEEDWFRAETELRQPAPKTFTSAA
jgi:hypothetical protein